jgi:hypothetical protein
MYEQVNWWQHEVQEVGGGRGVKAFWTHNKLSWQTRYVGAAKQGCHITVSLLKEKSLVTSLRNVSIIKTAEK